MIDRDERGAVRVPYYGYVRWAVADLDAYADHLLDDHYPIGSATRWSFRWPFLIRNERRPCAGCRSQLFDACEYAAWALDWSQHRYQELMQFAHQSVMDSSEAAEPKRTQPLNHYVPRHLLRQR